MGGGEKARFRSHGIVSGEIYLDTKHLTREEIESTDGVALVNRGGVFFFIQGRPLGWYFLLVSGPATLGIAGPGLKKNNNNRFFFEIFFLRIPPEQSGVSQMQRPWGLKGTPWETRTRLNWSNAEGKGSMQHGEIKKSSVPCACGAILPAHLPMT